MNQRKEDGGSGGAIEQALTEVIGNQGKSEALGRGRHNAFLRVAGENYTKTKHLVIACAACIILTHFITTIMLYNNGSFLFSFDSVNKLENDLDGRDREIQAMETKRVKGVGDFKLYRDNKNLEIQNLKDEISQLKNQNQMLIDAQLRYTDKLASFLNKKSNHPRFTTSEKNKNND